MAKLSISRVTLTMVLKVPEETLAERLVASPAVVGHELAQQVHRYVKRERLGYYPALEYFDNIPGAIDPDLLEAVRGIAWFVGNLVRSEVLHKLRAVFSHINIQDIRLLAFTLPQVRPNQLNALHELSEHYTPDRAKVIMEVSDIEKDSYHGHADRLAEHKVHRWLGQHFDAVDITSATLS